MPLNKVKLNSIPDGEITAVKLHQSGATDGQAMVWSNANGQWQPGAGGGGGSMSDLVDDTSPQLGGDLYLNSKNILGNGQIDITGPVNANNMKLKIGNLGAFTLETPSNTYGYYKIRNNSNDSSGNFGLLIEDDTGNDLAKFWSGSASTSGSFLYHNNTERLHAHNTGVKISGSLGVGTSTPNTEFDVVGEISVTNANGQRNGLYTNTDGQLVFFRNNFSNGATTMVIDDETGNVGIGGTPGSSSLFIYDSDYQQLEISGLRPTIWMTEDDGNANENFQLRVNGGKFLIQQQNDSQSNAQTRVTVTQAGNVGIGTENPTAGKVAIDAGTTTPGLHVTSANTTDTRITIDNTSADADYTYLHLATTGASQGDGYIIKNMEQGNGLPQGHTYLWTSGGTDNAISMVTNGDITKRATFNTDGSMTLRGVGGVEGHGMKLLASTEWTTGTAGAVFPVVDHSKYSAYQFYWVCDHAPNWFHTYLRMTDANGTVTNNIYNNNTSWKNCQSAGGAPDHNNSSYYGQRTQCWMAGNGTGYFSQGMGLISFEGSINRVLARGISQLSNRTSTDHYEESWSSAIDMVPSGVTGFTIYGSGGNSNRGYIKVFGIEK